MTNERKQRLLCVIADNEGQYYYNGPLDGIWGPESQKAADRFLKDFTGEDAADKNVGNETGEDKDKTGTFWDHIRYWSREEFRCRCGQYHAPYCNGFPVEPDQTLVELADDLRHKFGRPAHPSSGIRCERHNADQPGAATNSKHKYGKALDFFIEGVSGTQLLAAAQADPRTNYAYIIEGQYVHVDVK